MAEMPAAERRKGSVYHRKPRKGRRQPRKVTIKRQDEPDSDDEFGDELSEAATASVNASDDKHNADGSNTITFKIDHDLFDCPICNDPLRPPILQCPNGHFACDPCTKKLRDSKCPSCSLHAGSIRNLGLEAVVTAARVPCTFSSFGCRAVVSYSALLAHEASCLRAPCSCPVPGCHFQCGSTLLAAHIRTCHISAACVHEFTYGRVLTLFLRPEDPVLVFLGSKDDGRPVFLLARSSGGHYAPPGSAQMMVICLRPSPSEEKWEYEYEVAVTGNRTTLQLKAPPVNTTEWSGDFGDNTGLFIPQQLLGPQRLLKVNLRIRKIRSCSVD